jgi:hypothetical protein
MVEIPDSARPYVDGFLKYHFWILAAIVPCLLLPMVFAANGGLRQRISAQKASIDGHLGSLRGIQSETDHPNDSWVTVVDRRTADLRGAILQQWQAFWASQQPLRVWPEDLGPDFLATVQSLEDGSLARLPANLLQRYQNTVPDIVRTLPARMGCKESMTQDPGFGGGGGVFQGGVGAGDDIDSAEASLTHEPLVWRADNQKRLFTSFLWHREPSTAQVRLAQEELWIYGLFCDAIRTLNAGATGAFNATITSVDELVVGHPAAEDAPGGRGGNRIMWKVDLAKLAMPAEGSMEGTEGMDGMPPADPTAGVALGPLTRPSHPRFDAAAGAGFASDTPSGPVPGEGGLGEEGGFAPPPSPDDPLHEWIYVDFEGKPLTAEALKTSPDAAMVHLMPFTLRVVIDQRKIDALLQILAASSVPIDVRQVRINAGTQGGAMNDPLGSGGGGFAGGQGTDLSDRPRRPYDVVVELKGTVGIATPPNEAVLGGEPGGEDGLGDPS